MVLDLCAGNQSMRVTLKLKEKNRFVLIKKTSLFSSLKWTDSKQALVQKRQTRSNPIPNNIIALLVKSTATPNQTKE
jgi:hypothetical protein